MREIKKMNRKKQKKIFINKKNHIRKFKPFLQSVFISNIMYSDTYFLDIITQIKNNLEKTYNYNIDIVNIKKKDSFIEGVLKVTVIFKRSKDDKN